MPTQDEILRLAALHGYTFDEAKGLELKILNCQAEQLEQNMADEKDRRIAALRTEVERLRKGLEKIATHPRVEKVQGESAIITRRATFESLQRYAKELLEGSV